jgi:hypothetical protein
VTVGFLLYDEMMSTPTDLRLRCVIRLRNKLLTSNMKQMRMLDSKEYLFHEYGPQFRFGLFAN